MARTCTNVIAHFADLEVDEFTAVATSRKDRTSGAHADDLI